MHYQNIEHFTKVWGLQNIRKFEETKTSHLFLVNFDNTNAVLKLLKPKSDEQNSAKILKYFNGQGAVELLKHEGNALLLEHLEPKQNLNKMVLRGDYDKATSIIVDVIKQLHSPKKSELPKGIKNLRQHLKALFEMADSEPNSIYSKAAHVAEKLLADEKEKKLLHGDIHHENILHSDRGWLAIDPKGIVGERTYEVANTLCNPHHMPEVAHNPERLKRQASIFASMLDLDENRILKFAYVHSCISMCWSIGDKEDVNYSLQSFKALESLI